MRTLSLLSIAASVFFSGTLAWRGMRVFSRAPRGYRRSFQSATWGLVAQVLGTVCGALAFSALIPALGNSEGAVAPVPGTLGGLVLIAFAGLLSAQRWRRSGQADSSSRTGGSRLPDSAAGRALTVRATIAGTLMLLGFALL